MDIFVGIESRMPGQFESSARTSSIVENSSLRSSGKAYQRARKQSATGLVRFGLAAASPKDVAAKRCS